MFSYLNNLSIRASLFWGFAAMGIVMVLVNFTALLATSTVGQSVNRVLDQRIPVTVEMINLDKAVNSLVAMAAPLAFINNSEERDEAFELAQNALTSLEKTLDNLSYNNSDMSGVGHLMSSLQANVQRLFKIVDLRVDLAGVMTGQRERALLNLQAFQQSLSHRIRILQGDGAVIEQLMSLPEPPIGHVSTIAKDVGKYLPVARFYSEVESIYGHLLVASRAPTMTALNLARDNLAQSLENMELTFSQLPVDIVLTVEQPFHELQQFILAQNGMVQLRKRELVLLEEGKDIAAKNQRLTDLIETVTETMVSQGMTAVKDESAALAKIREHYFIIMIAVTLCGVIAILLMMHFHINRHVISRLSWLSKAMQDVANGRLQIALPPSGKNELGRLGSALQMFWSTTMQAEEREAALVESNKQAVQIRIALEEKAHELEIANSKLEQLSILDPLTGLYNRRRFDEALRIEWDRSGHAQKPLALMMIDVDHFKLFNDRYGHLAGDECLRKVAGVLLSCTRRAGDIAARYGGEEFCIISAYTDLSNARLLAEEVRSKVEALAIDHEGSCFGVVTISIGLSVSMSNSEHGCRDFLQSADKALYAAKDAGRNSVVEAP